MPPLKLTPKLVRTLGYGSGRAEHRDTIVRGLALRVTRKGRMYTLNYSIAGRNHRLNLGVPSEEFTLGQARTEAKAKLESIRRGANPSMERRQARVRAVLTVEGLVRTRIEAAKLKPSTRAAWLQILKAEITPLWGQRAAAELTRGEVREGLERIALRSGWTANHTLEVLRWAYARAVELELLEHSPCVGVKKPHKGEASERVLSHPEVRALWRALAYLGEGQYPDAVRLLLLTGVRRAMVLGSRAGEFDGCLKESARRGDALHGRQSHEGAERVPGISGPRSVSTPTADSLSQPDARWTIPGGFTGRSKSGRPHVVPLSPAALEVVQRRLALAKDGYLFPTWYKRRDGKPAGPFMVIPSQWIRRLKAATIWQLRREVGPGRRAAMAPWHLHNLRHTLATHLVDDLGRDDALVSLILGHKGAGPAVTRVYQRAERMPERRAALTAWAGWVEAVAEGERSNVVAFSP